MARAFIEPVALRFPQGQGTLVKVAVRNQKGKAVLDFKGVPLEQVSLLAEAITGELPPPSALHWLVKTPGV